MKNYETIIKERDKERDSLNAAKYEERETKEYLARYSAFSEHHKKVVVPIELKIGKPETRVAYAICGYSEKHGYFRNKYDVVESLKEAKKALETLKKMNDWGIPTLIIKVTFFRSKTPGCYDFDNNDCRNLGFSEYQEVVWKHKCGYTSETWKSLLAGFDNNYTY